MWAKTGIPLEIQLGKDLFPDGGPGSILYGMADSEPRLLAGCWLEAALEYFLPHGPLQIVADFTKASKGEHQ